MADRTQIKSALAALAEGDAPRDGAADERVSGRSVDNSPARECEGVGTVADQPARYRTVIERATNATDDIESAAAFVEAVGVATLETAVADAERELSGLTDDGRAALAAFERFRAAADGSEGRSHRG